MPVKDNEKSTEKWKGETYYNYTAIFFKSTFIDSLKNFNPTTAWTQSTNNEDKNYKIFAYYRRQWNKNRSQIEQTTEEKFEGKDRKEP